MSRDVSFRRDVYFAFLGAMLGFIVFVIYDIYVDFVSILFDLNFKGRFYAKVFLSSIIFLIVILLARIWIRRFRS